MPPMWEQWKKGFDVWERVTADYFESILKNPAVLGPAGGVLTATMRAKAASDRAATSLWGAMGLPTKRDQERTLHVLHRLESRILDLEERLEDQRR
jgi:hypothetical protein